mmetsp:Transcript_17745/g.29836  ORF Transcript_17745/g.29836 Transcript_17745/m.29836 type:complete len:206 (-) Transcript_17745:246-863(-)
MEFCPPALAMAAAALYCISCTSRRPPPRRDTPCVNSICPRRRAEALSGSSGVGAARISPLRRPEVTRLAGSRPALDAGRSSRSAAAAISASRCRSALAALARAASRSISIMAAWRWRSRSRSRSLSRASSSCRSRSSRASFSRRRRARSSSSATAASSRRASTACLVAFLLLRLSVGVPTLAVCAAPMGSGRDMRRGLGSSTPSK